MLAQAKTILYLYCGPWFLLAEAGSIAGIVGGVWSTVSENASPGMALGAVGVITALGAIAIPLAKLILESRDRDREFQWRMQQLAASEAEKDRAAKEARHDIAGKTQDAVIGTLANEKEIEALRRRIEQLSAAQPPPAVIVIPPHTPPPTT